MTVITPPVNFSTAKSNTASPSPNLPYTVLENIILLQHVSEN
jgi:hypothetical protein